MTTFDDILEEAGKFGRCQKRIFILLCMVSMPWAGVYVGIVFQGFTPDHWCRDPAVVERREACGWNLAESRRLTVPLDNSSGQQSSCEQYEVDWNATELTCDKSSPVEDLSRTPTISCKHGWEYDYEGRRSFVTEVGNKRSQPTDTDQKTKHRQNIFWVKNWIQQHDAAWNIENGNNDLFF